MRESRGIRRSQREYSDPATRRPRPVAAAPCLWSGQLRLYRSVLQLLLRRPGQHLLLRLLRLAVRSKRGEGILEG